jgi:hypothetical protein
MLERYKAFGKDGLLSLFEGISSRQSRVWYCLTGSLVRMMEERLEDAESPLYGRFRKLRVECFDSEDARVGRNFYLLVPVEDQGMCKKKGVISHRHYQNAKWARSIHLWSG